MNLFFHESNLHQRQSCNLYYTTRFLHYQLVPCHHNPNLSQYVDMQIILIYSYIYRYQEVHNDMYMIAAPQMYHPYHNEMYRP